MNKAYYNMRNQIIYHSRCPRLSPGRIWYGLLVGLFLFSGVFPVQAGSFSPSQAVAKSLPMPMNAPGSLQFESGAYTVSESVGTAVITVTRTGGNTGAVSALVNLNNLTTSAADYQWTGGGLDSSFEPGNGAN